MKLENIRKSCVCFAYYCAIVAHRKLSESSPGIRMGDSCAMDGN